MPEILTSLRVPNYASDPAGPATGHVYFNTGDNSLYYYNGSSFVALSSSSATGDVTGPSASSDNEVAVFSSTTGKVIKRSSTFSGLAKVTSGVLSTITDNSANWDIAVSEKRQWDGGSTNLTAATGRTSLGGTTVGQSFFTLTNPGAITFPKISAANAVTAESAATHLTSLGATTVGVDFLTLPNPGAITFPKIDSLNNVTAESAATHRTSIGATTVGSNFLTLTNPGAISFPKIDAANAVTAESAATHRTSLGLAIGSNVQAWDADLDSWAGITRASGFDAWVNSPSSANLRTLMTDENGTGALLFSGATTPDFTTGFTIGGAAASGKIPIGNGTNYVPSTPTYPNAASTTNKHIRSDGTNFVTTTETYAAPGTAGNLMVSDGTNWTSKADIITNASTSQQTLSNAEAYIVGSGITIGAGSMTAGSTYKVTIYITKSAGAAGMVVSLRIGTLGTTGDALVVTGTLAAGTALADTGRIDIYWTLRTTGASATSQYQATLYHNNTTAGLWNTSTIPITVGVAVAGSTFNSTTATKIGVTITGGTSFAGTIDMVQSEYNQF